jgi:hypothetical protein
VNNGSDDSSAPTKKAFPLRFSIKETHFLMKSQVQTLIMAHLEERRPWVALEDDEDAADETKRRGWFWTATIGFAVFVVVFPTVMLAATGHFSPHSGSSVDNGVSRL